MSDRDDDALERLRGPDLTEPEGTAPVGDRTVRGEHDRAGVPGWVLLGAAFVFLGGGVAYLLASSTSSKAFVYSKLVHEVLAEPSAFAGRELKVEGDLKPGSILFREQPCEWRFVLEKEGREMPVTFAQCIVPDTFRDGMGISVTVQGQLSADGRFEANTLVPKCPSKYDMQQRLEAGETAPHAVPSRAVPARAEPPRG